MNGYSPKEVKDPNLVSPVPASQANYPISLEIPVTYAGSLHCRVDIETSTIVGTVTAKLQQRSPTNGTYVDLAGANASVVITSNSSFSMTQLVERSADQPNLPLEKTLRVVITTAAASTAIISHVWMHQGL